MGEKLKNCGRILCVLDDVSRRDLPLAFSGGSSCTERSAVAITSENQSMADAFLLVSRFFRKPLIAPMVPGMTIAIGIAKSSPR